MKTKDPKKKFTKPTEGIKKASVKKAVTGKVAKTSEGKAKKAIRKSPIKAAPKTKKTEKKTEKKTLPSTAVTGKKTKAPIKKTAKQEASGPVQKSVKTLVKKKSDKAVQKPAIVKTSKPTKKTVKTMTKAVPKKKAVAGKAEVKVKPKSVVSKVSAKKPKPAVKAEKETAKRKVVTSKVKVEAKAKSVVSKISAIKSKPAVKVEKETAKRKVVTSKVKVKVKPKSVVSKVSAIKPKPAVKAEKKAQKKKAVTVRAKVKETAVKAGLKKVPKLVRTKAPRTVSKENKAVAAKGEPAVLEIPSLKSVATAKKYATKEGPKPKAEPYPIKSFGAGLKIFLPDQDLTKEEAEDIFLGGLPEEYGENAVIALAVDPNTVFVDWEVIPGDIADMEGDLNLRFYDITGIEFNDWNAHSVIDVPISKRVGSGFFDIRMPGCDVVVAVGILNAVSGFMTIVRSDTVSFPVLLTFDELGIVRNLFESGIPVGY